MRDPTEQRNLAAEPVQAAVLAKLQAEIIRLQKQLGDTGQFADAIPQNGVDVPVDVAKLGAKSVKDAIASARP